MPRCHAPSSRLSRALRTGLLPALAAIAAIAAVTTPGASPVASHAARPSLARLAAATTHHCLGKVARVDDGDTLDVKLLSGCYSFSKGQVLVIRNASIQSTEIAHGSTGAQCWSAPAMNHLAKLLPVGHHVRLSSYHLTRDALTDAAGHSRFSMYVDKAMSDGSWYDVQKDLLLNGLVLAKPDKVETARNAAYIHAMQVAQANHLGMWGDPHRCGSTDYAPNAALKLWINWKMNGPDSSKTPNMEWLRLRNTGTSTLNLGHWKLRAGSRNLAGFDHTFYTFPSGTVLDPGQTLTVYPGNGTDDIAARRVYLHASRAPYFVNVHMANDRSPGGHLGAARAYPGQELYLLDPALNFRGWGEYPCVYRCSWPDVHIASVAYQGDNEAVVIRNSSASSQDLTGVDLEYDGWTKEIRPGTVLPPGGQLVVHVARNGSDTATNAYWPHSHTMLRDAGGELWLRTADDVTIDIATWGANPDSYYHY